MLEANIVAKENEIDESNTAITRKVKPLVLELMSSWAGCVQVGGQGAL